MPVESVWGRTRCAPNFPHDFLALVPRSQSHVPGKVWEWVSSRNLIVQCMWIFGHQAASVWAKRNQSSQKLSGIFHQQGWPDPSSQVRCFAAIKHIWKEFAAKMNLFLLHVATGRGSAGINSVGKVARFASLLGQKVRATCHIRSQLSRRDAEGLKRDAKVYNRIERMRKAVSPSLSSTLNPRQSRGYPTPWCRHLLNLIEGPWNRAFSWPMKPNDEANLNANDRT